LIFGWKRDKKKSKIIRNPTVNDAKENTLKKIGHEE